MKKYKVFILIVVIGFNSCNDFLDVVPDGMPTIDMAFKSRIQTLKYLATCYSHMPIHGHPSNNPALLGCDEIWTEILASGARMTYNGYYIGLGRQNAAAPLLEQWGAMYLALRDCNIFLENVGIVPDLQEWERNQWIAEVKVLKAYYHFCLVQMYGPVPLIRENLPIDVDISKVKVEREPVDDCFQYIVELLDEAIDEEMLPPIVYDVASEYGRITKSIALSLKAKILVTAASPLYNGNSDQATLQNRDGTKLFNTTPDPTKWEKAVVACKEAIDACHETGIELYYFPNIGTVRVGDTITTQMSLRNAFNERYNCEIIWANMQSITGTDRNGLQHMSAAKLDNQWRDSFMFGAFLNAPIKIANMFYTDKGVPIEDDKDRDAGKLYDFREAQEADKLYVRMGETTVDMHFDREPRFYAWLGFDRGIWFGQGRINDNSELWTLYCRNGELDGVLSGYGPYTGFFIKKYVYYMNTIPNLSSYSTTRYPWPLMRLSDLYLLYAEAINEAEGPNGANSSELFEYINRVRTRAGLEGVKDSWDKYTNNPKYNNQLGMRQIIQRERMIELSFEGQRFWDMRRWKIAQQLYQTPIDAWNTKGSDRDAYYTRRVVSEPKFGIRDYFWPISDSDILNNRNLVQNIGW